MSLSSLCELSIGITVGMVILLTIPSLLETMTLRLRKVRIYLHTSSTGQSSGLWPTHVSISSVVTCTHDNLAEIPVSLLSNGDVAIVITMLLYKKSDVKEF